MSLTDRVAIVTGAGSGIGAAVAARMAADGARVVAVDIDGDAAERVASSLPGSIAMAVDITVPEQVDKAVRASVDALGSLDVLANIAGIDDPVTKSIVGAQVAAGEPIDVTSELPDERWDRVLRVNADGTFFMTRAALRVMLPAGSGSIINMSSLAGVIGVAGLPHYSAAKAAIIGFTQSVAKEVAGRGVRVNVIAPGPVVTPMTDRTRAVGMGGDVPVGKWAEASEIAALVAFLAGDEARYITGETININGGMSTV